MAIILINAHAGVGKLTIAKALHFSLTLSVFSNHTLIDTAATLYERDHPAYRPLRKALRQTIFTSLVDAKAAAETLSKHEPSRPIIFTECTGVGPYSSGCWAPEYLELARALDVPFISVRLTCEETVSLQRLVDRAEAAKGTTKLLDTEIARFWREHEVTYEFGTEADVEMTLDVTDSSPEESARAIVSQKQQQEKRAVI